MNPILPSATPVLETPVPSTCKQCGYQVLNNYYFCPNCGKKLKNPPLSTSIGKQIYLYLLSALLPPLGLWPGIKYLLDKRPKAKIIGAIAIILTVVSIAITLQLTMSLLNGQKDVASQQLQQFENAGY